MTEEFENCRAACPYWLSTIRGVQVPSLAEQDVPDSVRPEFTAILQAIRSGTLPAAAPAVDQALRHVGPGTPAEAFLLVVASLVRMNAGDLPAARDLLDVAVTRHPQAAAVYQARGVVRLRQQDHAGAVADFKACVSLNRDSGDAWAALAVIHAVERSHPATELAARQALRLGVQQHGLVPLALMQATYLQGKPVEGAMDFSSLEQPGEARVVEWLAGFPPVDTRSMVHRHGRPVYFIYADDRYVIEHAIPLILSLAETRAEAAVHLHVANPGRGLQQILARLQSTLGRMPLQVSSESVLVEQYAAPPIYHSCMRFVRMYQLLTVSDSPVVMLDADVLVRRNPVPLVIPPPLDFVVSRSVHDPLWSTFYGGYLQVNPTPAGRGYLGQAAAFILDNIRKKTARWFLDQTALAVCFDRFREGSQFSELPDGATRAQDYSGEEYFWTAVNENKYADNLHTREKRRLQTMHRFEPEELERQRAADPIETSNAVQAAVAAGLPNGIPSWSPFPELATASRDFLQMRLARNEDPAVSLETVHFHLVMAFAYSAQFKLYDACRGRVVSGPFRGMRFPPPRQAAKLDDTLPVSGGAFNIAGLLLGTYESELHAAIESLLSSIQYEVVVDVGCSLGYYAVGIAMRQPHARVHARDTNLSMHGHVRELAELNGVSGQLSVAGEWAPADFHAVRGKRSLVFCDIEGAELGLLDPATVPELVHCDIIVEMHDVFDPKISTILCNRFRDSHEIEIVATNGPRPALPPEAAGLTRHERSALLADLRLGPTPWAIMRTRQPQP